MLASDTPVSNSARRRLLSLQLPGACAPSRRRLSGRQRPRSESRNTSPDRVSSALADRGFHTSRSEPCNRRLAVPMPFVPTAAGSLSRLAAASRRADRRTAKPHRPGQIALSCGRPSSERPRPYQDQPRQAGWNSVRKSWLPEWPHAHSPHERLGCLQDSRRRSHDCNLPHVSRRRPPRTAEDQRRHAVCLEAAQAIKKVSRRPLR